MAAIIYLVFNEGCTDADAGSARARLCTEAIRLARLMLRLFAADPEMMSLLAIMLLQHSRRHARLAADGSPVLLDHQDRALWDGGP